MTTFEEEMDRESKKRNRFDIKKFKNAQYTVQPQMGTENSEAGPFQQQVTQQTPRGPAPQNNMQNLQQSQVVYAGGFEGRILSQSFAGGHQIGPGSKIRGIEE